MKAELMKITPEIARQYLERNTANYRALSNVKVKSYAEDMRNGRWETNGEAIVFSKDGTLKNGQHRLHAIIESGATIELLVVTGVSDDATIYDWGMGRTVNQWGKANGIHIPTPVAGAAKIICSGFRAGQPKGTVTKYIETHYDELKEANRISGTGKKNALGYKASVCLAVYIFRRYQLLHDDVLENFFRIFNTGTIDAEQRRDPSAPLVASRQFLTKIPSGSAASQMRQFEVVMQALQDFKKNKNRKKEYGPDPHTFEFLTEIQKTDGFEPSK